MDVKLLEYLLVIERLGSISAAAEEIHISQSALSQNLARLENSLKTPVFVRVNKRLVPSPEGKVYLDGARQVIRIKEETYKKIQARIRKEKSLVRMAICPQVYEVSGDRILAALKKRFPGLHFEYRSMDSVMIHECLVNDLADLGIFCSTKRENSLLDCLSLFREKLVLAVPDPDGTEGSAAPEEICRKAFICQTKGTFLGELVYRNLKERGLTPLELYMAQNVGEMKMLAEQGYGAALLPESTVKDLRRCHILKWEPELEYEVMYGTRKEGRLPSYVREIREVLYQCVMENK